MFYEKKIFKRCIGVDRDNICNIYYLHIYFHSFRFAQGTKRYENVSLSLFFIYNSSCRELGILQITGR